MSNDATDRFKHQFEMLLRDTIKPEIEIAKNTLLEVGNAKAPAQLSELGVWAADLLKAAVESEVDEIQDVYQKYADDSGSDDWDEEE